MTFCYPLRSFDRLRMSVEKVPLARLVQKQLIVGAGDALPRILRPSWEGLRMTFCYPLMSFYRLRMSGGGHPTRLPRAATPSQ